MANGLVYIGRNYVALKRFHLSIVGWQWFTWRTSYEYGIYAGPFRAWYITRPSKRG